MREPFDASEPFNAVAEAIRQRVGNVALEAIAMPEMRKLDRVQQVECLTAGLLIGSVGSLLTPINPDGHDEFMRFLEVYLPEAQQAFYDITANSPKARFQ